MKERRFPEKLQKGDVVGVFSPSDWFYEKSLRRGLSVIEDWGLRVKLAENVRARVDDFMAGTVEQRAADLRELIFDEEVAALWAAEGGYAAPDIRHVLAEKEIEHLRKYPKLLVGYSDVNVLTNSLFRYGLVSVCGPNICGLADWKPKSQEWMRRILMGGKLDYPSRGRVFVEGETEGVILASNLDSLVINFGTKYDPLMGGQEKVILLVEELREDISRLQRHFEAIFDHDNIDRISALILGRLSMLHEGSYPGWAKNVDIYNLILEKMARRNRIPFAQIDYFGHASTWSSKARGTENNLAWVNGARMAVSIKGGKYPRHGKVIFSCLDE